MSNAYMLHTSIPMLITYYDAEKRSERIFKNALKNHQTIQGIGVNWQCWEVFGRRPPSLPNLPNYRKFAYRKYAYRKLPVDRPESPVNGETGQLGAGINSAQTLV